MSFIFLFIFSFAMQSSAAGLDHPMNYLISGVIIMTVFQSALNNSMNILEDISSGFMKEILVAPITRWQIAIGQILSSALIAVLQGLIVLVVGFFMGLHFGALQFVLIICLMSLVGITFSSIGLYLAALAKNSTTFQLLITIVSLPLTFLSGAYIPTMLIPHILHPVVYLNPLTYTTSAFRYISLKMDGLSVPALVKSGVAFDVHGFIIMPYLGAIIVAVIGVVFFVLCVNQFNGADFSRVKVFKRGGHR
jgi:ABC-2 type transport system permease protein